jgi:hypothetical protein
LENALADNFTSAVSRLHRQRQPSENSLDSHAFGHSSSESDLVVEQSPIKAKKSLQPRLYPKTRKTQIQSMMSRKKGFDIIDAEELYHMMYNPYFESWKQKKQSYVKYNNRSKKRTMSYRPQKMSEKDEYLAKEVRTFDEVFKQIKNKQKEHE